MSPSKYIGCLIVLLTIPHTFAQKNTFCYFDISFPFMNLDPFMCTHIVYYSHSINDDASLSKRRGSNIPDYNTEFSKLKISNPQLKTLIQIGGYKANYEEFYKISGNEALRKTFASNVVKLAMQLNFNGVHLVWSDDNLMYSMFSNEERENFSALLEEMRKETAQNSLLFTCAIKITARGKIISYDIPKIVKNLDFLILSPANQYSNKYTTYMHEMSYIKSTVDNAISMGVPVEKIILELSFTGLKYKLKNPSRNLLGALTIGGPTSSFYRQICQLRTTWTEGWDDNEKVTYIYKGNEWISYESKRSLSSKVDMAMSVNLAGFYTFLSYDDYNNVCKEGKFPLVNHLKTSIKEFEVLIGSETKTTKSITTSDSTGICKASGYINDPNDCNKFYYCIKNENGSFKTMPFNCPDGLMFDQKLLICNYLYIFGNDDL